MLGSAQSISRKVCMAVRITTDILDILVSFVKQFGIEVVSNRVMVALVDRQHALVL